MACAIVLHVLLKREPLRARQPVDGPAGAAAAPAH